MTVLLVVLTVLLFIVAEWYVLRRRRRIADAAVAAMVAAEPVTDPAELFWHPGHTWVQPLPQGLVKIGTSDFAACFAGEAARIVLPREGHRLRQGERAWTLVSAKGRRLPQLMPVNGRVVAVNRALLEDARRVGRQWILLVRPRRLEDSLCNLLRRTAAKTWFDATRDKVASQLSPALGVVANDGGEWVPGFGDLLEESVWQTIRSEVFPATRASSPGQ